ncbi:hypothetical protein [Parvularcula maris]|uniref:Uncharacterized protein n=1 Tax=Parvularcula maris TaxID=2965077 RepID=A0A9X2RJZ8_9PROT|nr:hypothetical protein [Parvularcula maris]MCQ8186406.1 hypothetical protein [Parvularcula maris]
MDWNTSRHPLVVLHWFTIKIMLGIVFGLLAGAIMGTILALLLTLLTMGEISERIPFVTDDFDTTWANWMKLTGPAVALWVFVRTLFQRRSERPNLTPWPTRLLIGIVFALMVATGLLMVAQGGLPVSWQTLYAGAVLIGIYISPYMQRGRGGGTDTGAGDSGGDGGWSDGGGGGD